MRERLSRARSRVRSRWLIGVVVLPLVAGALLATVLDPSAPPVFGRERVTAVLLLDGQAYFGKLADAPWADSIALGEVYYFQDARSTTTNVPLALARRGTELHQPTGSLALRRDKVLAIEAVRPDSAVMTAILTDRAIQTRTIQ